MPNPERLFARSHLGFCQDAFSYLKARCCLFWWCASYIWSCFFYLYLFAELLSEWRDHVRAEKLLSSAAKIVFLIIHELRLYTGLMANSTSDLLLVNSISKEMLSLQTQEPLSELSDMMPQLNWYFSPIPNKSGTMAFHKPWNAKKAPWVNPCPCRCGYGSERGGVGCGSGL